MVVEKDKQWVKKFILDLADELVLSESRLRRILEEAFKMKNKELALNYIVDEVWALISVKIEDVVDITEEKNSSKIPATFVAGYLTAIEIETKTKLRVYALQFWAEAKERSLLQSFYAPKINKDILKMARDIANLPSTAKSSITNLKVITTGVLADAYNRADLRLMRNNGITGYIGVRQSSFDCPLCDSLCGYVIPIETQVFPAHPRCVCGMIPFTE